MKKITVVAFVVVGLLISKDFIRSFLVVRVPMPKADAIVVLAGEYKEKIPAVATLYKDGYAPRIVLANDGVFSSWSKKYNRNLYQVEWAEESLVNLEVPREAIVKLPFIKSGTYYDALSAKRFITDNGMKKIMLVTSDYHTRRSSWIFHRLLRDYGAEVGVFPTKSPLTGLKNTLQEYSKFGYYLLRYGICRV